MADFGFLSQVKRVRGNGIAGQRLQGERRNELLGVSGHYDTNCGSCLDQEADDLCRLIGGNTAAYSKKDVFVL